jgi:hypothetical protein
MNTFAKWLSAAVLGVLGTIFVLVPVESQIVGPGAPAVSITGTSGVPAEVDDDGQLHVVLEGKEITSNSTAIPLDVNEVYTGTSFATDSYSILVINVYADKGSATDGLSVQFSSDGTNWDHLDVFTIPAVTGKVFSFQTVAEFCRVVYTNGTEAQTVFRLQTVGKKQYSKPSSHRIKDTISGEDDAELVKAALTGADATGAWQNVRTTEDGYLSVSNNCSGLAIAKGDVTDHSFLHKFGAAPDFDSGDGMVTIWDGADDGHVDQMAYVYSTVADINTVSSDSGSDTFDAEIQGLDASWDVLVQTVTLAGQAKVTLPVPIIRVFRIKNVGTADNVGHVYCYSNSAIVTGTPSDSTAVRAVVQPGNNQTLMAVYTIPNGCTGYMRSWYANLAGASKTSNYLIEVRARPTGQVFQLKHKSALVETGSSGQDHKYVDPEVFAAKTDLEVRASATAGGVSGASVSAGFDIVLIAD